MALSARVPCPCSRNYTGNWSKVAKARLPFIRGKPFFGKNRGHHSNFVTAANSRVLEQLDFDDDEDGDYVQDNAFAVLDKDNIEPNFFDPEWSSKVTDWDEFWNYTRWDEEIQGVDQEVDAGGHPTRSRERIQQMIDSLKDMDKRTDVMNLITPVARRDHLDRWEYPVVAPESFDLVPDMSACDIRALAEKTRQQELLDIEWRRRQSKIGKATYVDPSVDMRLEPFHWDDIEYEGEFTEQDFRNLITMNGTACPPERHKALVGNPLRAVDFVNTMNLTYIPETEEFLESIGRLAEPEQFKRLPKEVIIDLDKDLIDPAARDEILEHDVHVDYMESLESAGRDNTYRPDPDLWEA